MTHSDHRAVLSPERLAYLRGIDSPTVANALELFNLRDRREGFIGGKVQCAFPDLGVMVGRALTVTMANTPGVTGGGGGFWKLWDALNTMDSPSVVVIADASGNPSRVAYAGEIMASLALRLGAVGMVTDGGLRDVSEVHALGFHYYMRYPVVSHANFDVIDVGEPVVVDGAYIETGALLHGDANGIVVIPDDALADLPGAVAKVQARERSLLSMIRDADISLDTLKSLFS